MSKHVIVGDVRFLVTDDVDESDEDALHDWPLPSGYIDASEMASSRLRRRWKNQRCPDCGKFGWRPGEIRDDVKVPADG